MNYKGFATIAALVAITGCAQNSTMGPPSVIPASRWIEALRIKPNSASQKIQHVVVIVQENRSTNDLFNALQGANTTQVGLNSYGQQVQLEQQLLTAPYDISHKHDAFETEYAKGNMDGWNLVLSRCKPTARKKCPPKDIRAYGYVPETEVEPYYAMAQSYVFGNDMFETNEGPSFPAHQYILSGTSTISNGSNFRAAENPRAPTGKYTGGCDSPQGSTVLLIDQNGNERKTAYPCFDRNSLIQLIEAQNLTWHYYQSRPGPGLWKAPDAILPVYNSPEFAYDVVSPPSRVLTDIKSGNLSNVVWVTPTAKASDHAGSTDGSGPSWVASVVNAIGESKYWKKTAIFVTWDDWGGWFDSVAPPQYNSYELGFRVPLIVISAYAKKGYISTKQHEFGSILKFTEETFNLGSLGTTDVRSDDLSDCFDFSKKPRKFVPISAPHGASYFLHLRPDNATPDDDF